MGEICCLFLFPARTLGSPLSGFFFSNVFYWTLNTEVFSSRIHIPEKAEKSTPRTSRHNKTAHGKGKICSFILE